MTDKELASTLSTAALIALIIAVVFYIISIAAIIKRLSAHKTKTSGAGVTCVILATIFAISAILLYAGFSLWTLIAVVVVDSVLIMLLTE